jgi:hypothetical protein
MAGPGKRPNRKKGVKKPKQAKKQAAGHRKAARKGRGKKRSNPQGPNSMRKPRAIAGQNMLKGGFTLGSTATSRFKQVIEEDEYIGEVNGSVSFATTAYNINPAQSGSFPWGNKIAQLYERYDFEMLEFYLCSEVSAYATQGQTGVVMMSVDYDASDVAPTSKQQVLDTDPHTVPCLPSVQKPIILRLDCKEMRSSDAKYCRPGAQPANTDIKTYDAGVLYVSTQGNANTSNIGELHVRYRCRLKKPVLESGISQNGAAMHFNSITSTTANNFAGAVLQPGFSPALANINLSAVANTITFPTGVAGNYFVSVSLSAGTSVSAISFAGSTGGISNLELMTASATTDSTNQSHSLAGTTISPAMVIGAFSVTNAGGAVALNPGTIVTSGTASLDVFIFALPVTLLTMDEQEQLEIDELKDSLSTLKRDFDEMKAFMRLRQDPSSSSSPSPVLVYSKKELLNLRPPLIHTSELGTAQIESEDPEVDLSASYIQRVGEALGVKKSSSRK